MLPRLLMPCLRAKHPFRRIQLVAFILFAARAMAQVEYVDPTIGNIGILLVPTRPAVYLPNSMIRVYPIREDATSDRISSFPLTISSHRMEELFSIMPGESTAAAAYDQEKTTPYYYSTRFDESLIQTEFSPTERCGYFRFHFPRGHASICPPYGLLRRLVRTRR